jgi:hypothetical protein
LIKAKALFQQHNVRAGGASGLTLRDVIRAAQRVASVDGDDDIVCLFACVFVYCLCGCRFKAGSQRSTSCL